MASQILDWQLDPEPTCTAEVSQTPDWQSMTDWRLSPDKRNELQMWLADDGLRDDGDLNPEPEPDPCGSFARAACELMEQADKTAGIELDHYSRVAGMTSLLCEDLEEMAEGLNRLKAKNKESSNEKAGSEYPLAVII